MVCSSVAALDLVDIDRCRAFLVRRLHPAGGRCPDCGVSLDGRQAEGFATGGRVRCNSCKRWFTWRTRTIFHRMTMDERQLFLLLLLTGMHCSLEQIAEVCHLLPDDVYSWQQKIKEACN